MLPRKNLDWHIGSAFSGCRWDIRPTDRLAFFASRLQLATTYFCVAASPLIAMLYLTLEPTDKLAQQLTQGSNNMLFLGSARIGISLTNQEYAPQRASARCRAISSCKLMPYHKLKLVGSGVGANDVDKRHCVQQTIVASRLGGPMPDNHTGALGAELLEEVKR